MHEEFINPNIERADVEVIGEKKQNDIDNLEISLAWGSLPITRELRDANVDIYNKNLQRKRYRELLDLPDKLPKLEQMVQTPYFNYRYIGI